MDRIEKRDSKDVQAGRLCQSSPLDWGRERGVEGDLG